MKSIAMKLLFAAAIPLSLCQLALAGSGDLDLSFGGTGKIVDANAWRRDAASTRF